jgi:hypothetical protein
MLKKICLAHMFDALEHEGETRHHQGHKVLKGTGGIENVRSHLF